MSELTYLFGPIQPDQSFYILSSLYEDEFPDLFTQPNALGSKITNWSVLGVQDTYVDFDKYVYKKPFYYKDYDNKYYYPLYLFSDTGNRQTKTFTEDAITLSFYYDNADTSTANVGKTEPPSVDFGYKSYDCFRHIPFKIDKNWPIYLEAQTADYSAIQPAIATHTDVTFYRLTATTPWPRTTDAPETTETFFYNPKDMLTDTKFQYNHHTKKGFDIELVSTGKYVKYTNNHKHIGITNNTIEVDKNGNNSTKILLSTTHNINHHILHAGVPYKMTNGDDDDVKVKFISSIENGGCASILQDYDLSTKHKGTYSALNSVGFATIPDYLSMTSVPVKSLFFYFIPTNTYDARNGHHHVYSGNHPLDYTITYICRVDIKDLHPSASGGYLTHKRDNGDVNSTEVALHTTRHSARNRKHPRTCKTKLEHCGPCYGISLDGQPCVHDSVSSTSHPEEYFTSDPDRHIDMSEHISKSAIGTHSKTLIILICVLVIVIITGIVLYYERKTILKHMHHIKR